MSDAKLIGQRLVMARMLRLGLSQADMADRYGVTVAVLQRAEKGEERSFLLEAALMDPASEMVPETLTDGSLASEPHAEMSNDDLAAGTARAREAGDRQAEGVKAVRNTGILPASEPDPYAERRKLWRAHSHHCALVRSENAARHERFVEAARSGHYRPAEPQIPNPRFPDELRGLPCGARTRKGGRCKRTDLMSNGRCKFHGGLSTGPKTDTGRQAGRANLRKRWSGKGTSMTEVAKVEGK